MNADISAWAIRHPLPSILLFVLLTAAGLHSFSRLPITYFPTIDTPEVTVTIEQPGATPTAMEVEVTRRVENAVAPLPGVVEISSTIGEGRSVTSVEFELGRVSPDRAVVAIRDAVAMIRSDLPPTIDEPIIERVEENSQSAVTYSLSSPTMSIGELSWYVDDVIERSLQGLPGVGRIERVGGTDREIRVELDPNRLQALSLTADQVNESLLRTQIETSGGRASFEGREHALTTVAAVETVSDLADHRIALSANRTVRLGDLALVEDTSAEPRSFAELNGNEVVGFAVYPSQGASEVTVAQSVALKVTELGAADTDLRFSLVDDNVTYTTGNYASAISTLWEGCLLAIVVVFLFLRDWRATMIAAVALPLSIIPTLFLIDLLGFSLNILSLLAITLVTGILVDDAIVEIENVMRHRERGKSAYDAALDASEEIGLAVMAISATIIAVFVPVGFMAGEVGLYFREFGLTVAIAVFFSLLVARLITPVMAAYLMAGKLPAGRGKRKLVHLYVRLLKVSLRWRWITVALAACSFGLAVLALSSMPTAFLPEEDIGRLTLTVELPAGSTLEDTLAVTGEIARDVREIIDVGGVFTRAGSSATGLEDVRYAVVLIHLRPKTERDRSSFAIEREVAEKLASLPDVKLTFLNTRGGRDLSFALLSTDGGDALEAANAIMGALSTDPMFVDPAIENAAMRPELKITIDTDKAAMLGISPAVIAETIRVSTLGDVDSRLPVFNEDARQIPIRVILDRDAPRRLETLGLLMVSSDHGGRVPLSAVAEISFAESVSAIERLDRERRIEIGVDMAAGFTSGQGMEQVLRLESVRDLSPGVRLVTTGDSDTEGAVFESFAVAMVYGITLVLVVLILLFGSVFAPLTILASLPLSVGGVAAGLWLSGYPISLPVVIGILMLMGIVTKNAILLLDFAVEREASGMSRVDSVIEACCERVRPIIMTTLAMIGGMVPSALGLGDGGEFRSPMAVAVIGGLVASTLLSLIVFPALHLIVSDIGDRASRILKPLLLAPKS